MARKNIKDVIPQRHRHAKEHARRSGFHYQAAESFGLRRRIIGQSAARLSLAVTDLCASEVIPQQADVRSVHNIVTMPLSLIGRQASTGLVSYQNVQNARRYFEAQSQQRTGPLDVEITDVATRWKKHLYLVVDSQQLEEERQHDAEVLASRFGFKDLPAKIVAQPLMVEIAACHKSASFAYNGSTSNEALAAIDLVNLINEPLQASGLDVYPEDYSQRAA